MDTYKYLHQYQECVWGVTGGPVTDMQLTVNVTLTGGPKSVTFVTEVGVTFM